MSDNALDTLFEEMRETEIALNKCKEEANRLSEARKANNDKLNDLGDRRQLLERTLRKHIHEGLPIVQAKMMAHEEPAESDTQYVLSLDAASSRISTASITAQRHILSQMAAAIVAK